MLHQETPRLILRARETRDAAALCAYYTQNREHFAATDPFHPPEFYTEAYWHKHIAETQGEVEAGTSLRTVFCLREAPAQVVATSALTQISRGAFLACYFGYGMAAVHQGKGLMTEGLRALLEHAFGPMGLHRIMANYLPDNMRSAAVLAKLGFEREGLATDYLFITEHGETTC